MSVYREPRAQARVAPPASLSRRAWAWCRGVFGRLEERSVGHTHDPECPCRHKRYRELGVPCVCIDVRLDRIQSRLDRLNPAAAADRIWARLKEKT